MCLLYLKRPIFSVLKLMFQFISEMKKIMTEGLTYGNYDKAFHINFINEKHIPSIWWLSLTCKLQIHMLQYMTIIVTRDINLWSLIYYYYERLFPVLYHGNRARRSVNKSFTLSNRVLYICMIYLVTHAWSLIH